MLVMKDLLIVAQFSGQLITWTDHLCKHILHQFVDRCGHMLDTPRPIDLLVNVLRSINLGNCTYRTRKISLPQACLFAIRSFKFISLYVYLHEIFGPVFSACMDASNLNVNMNHFWFLNSNEATSILYHYFKFL
jgi:hypothetical protein